MDKLAILNKLLNQNASYPYQSNLDVPESFGFANWASTNNVPVDLNPKADYDMAGYYKNLNNPGIQKAALNNITNSLHFPDTFKTPTHKTFSNESIYADQNAPHWNETNTALIDNSNQPRAIELPNGEILKVRR